MQQTDYQIAKDHFLLQPVAYKEVARNEIVAESDNHYRIGSAVVQLTDDMVFDIDKYLGIMPKQSQMAQRSYGEKGISNLRNFFAQADNSDDTRVIFVADTKNRTISHIHQTNSHLIPPESFFDFAEMFMDRNNYEPEEVQYNDGSEVSILMRSGNPEYMEFAKDDAFESNGLWLRWNPTEIAFGNYYLRLVCSNGMTTFSEHKLLQTNSLQDEKSLKRMLTINSENGVLKQNLNKMLGNARVAMNTQASLHELGTGVRMLQRLGVEEQDATQLIPYMANRIRYEQAGYTLDANGMRHSVSDTTVWQLFNTLTAFASHNPTWAQHDLRRSQLMSQSVNLLNQKRDIMDYNNVYMQ